MDTSIVRRRVIATIERAKRAAAERRARGDETARAYGEFLQHVAIPLVRQVAGALKASGYLFVVSTPAGAVRLTSEKTSEDYIELSLDTSGNQPVVMARISRARGRGVVETERPLAEASIGDLTEEQVLEFLVMELAPFVER